MWSCQMKSTKSQTWARLWNPSGANEKRQSSSIEANVENVRDGPSSSPLVYNASKMKPAVSPVPSPPPPPIFLVALHLFLPNLLISNLIEPTLLSSFLIWVISHLIALCSKACSSQQPHWAFKTTVWSCYSQLIFFQWFHLCNGPNSWTHSGQGCWPPSPTLPFQLHLSFLSIKHIPFKLTSLQVVN